MEAYVTKLTEDSEQKAATVKEAVVPISAGILQK